VTEIEKVRKQIRCPYCGYRMPIYYDPDASAKGIFVRCKGRDCRKEFEVDIHPDK
jgi:hypothetical protein